MNKTKTTLLHSVGIFTASLIACCLSSASADIRNATTITAAETNVADVVAVGYISLTQDQQNPEAISKSLDEQGYVKLHFDPIITIKSNVNDLNTICLSNESIEFNSSLLGLAVLGTRLPVLVVLKQSDECLYLSSLASWSLWPFSGSQPLANLSIVAEKFSDIKWPNLQKRIGELIRDPAVEGKNLDPAREAVIRKTFERLFVHQAAIIQNSFGISNSSFLMQRFQDELLDNPKNLPSITLEIVREPNIVTLVAALSLMEQTGFNLSQKSAIQFMIARLIAKLPKEDLKEAFALFKNSTYPESIIQEYFAALSNYPKILTLQEYASTFFQVDEDTSKYLILASLKRTNLPNSPNLPSLALFQKDPTKTLQEWTDFLENSINLHSPDAQE